MFQFFLVKSPVSDGAGDSALVLVFQLVMFYGLPVCHRLPGVSCPSRHVTDYPLFHGLPDVSQSAQSVRSVTLMSEWQTGKTAASLLLQRLGRVGAGSAEGLPEDGGESNNKCR